MWRAMFIALGFYCCLLGVECLLIEKAVLANHDAAPVASRLGAHSRDLVPPDWAPWSLLSAGAVTMLYTFTIPKRAKE
ncbi:MAG TPA: hypothetical protein VIK18_07615 [Pirellulales bacterium]